MDFICVGCTKSLLQETYIARDSRDRQYCQRCWKDVQAANKTKLEIKYPPGSTVSWMGDDFSRSRSSRKTGTVVKCTRNRIRVKHGSRYSWIDEESVFTPTT